MEWNLNAYYMGFEDKSFSEDLEFIKTFRPKFTIVVEALNEDKNLEEKFSKYINELSSFISVYIKLASFARLSITVNSRNSVAKKYLEQITKCYDNIIDLIEVAEEVLCSLDFDTLFEKEKLLEFEYYINEIKKSREHKLSPSEEKMVSMLSKSGSTAWLQYKDEIISNMKIDFEGKKLPLTTILTYAYSADKALRKKAYEAELASYKSHEAGINAALNAIKGEAITISKLRGYESVLDMTINETRITSKTLDALISAIEKSLPAFRKYFIAKAKYLGNSKMHWYDMYAPTTETLEDVSYEKAKQIVLDAFKGYSADLHDFALNAMNNSWIDVYPKEGKTSGAFCSSCKTIGESRILLNYGNSIGDVGTLAHELGHGYHALCLKNEHLLNSNYPMVLAETASNFCEIITKKYLLSIVDEDTKLAILETEISDMAQVIVDIYSRFNFEKSFLEKREEGYVSVEETKQLMLDAQKIAYGDSFDSDFLHPYMWTWKPHYYNVKANFYNYPYAFGALFSKGLYSNYLNDKSSFIENYNKLLASTGKNDVVDVCMLANIDVESVDFWTSALEVVVADIEEFVNQLKM